MSTRPNDAGQSYWGALRSAYGGREDLMRMIAPDGQVYQAGTLSGNPLAVAAGRTTLGILESVRYLFRA